MIEFPAISVSSNLTKQAAYQSRHDAKASNERPFEQLQQFHRPFALQVIGDNMAPEFPDACIVVIEPSDWCQHGMYVMALVEGYGGSGSTSGTTCERLVASTISIPRLYWMGYWKVEGIIMQRTLRRANRFGPTRGQTLQVRLATPVVMAH